MLARMRAPPTLLRRLCYALALAFLYYVFVKIGLMLRLQPQDIAAVWPPCGFMLAALLRSERRDWALIVGAIFAADFTGTVAGGRPVLLAFSYASANGLATLVSAWLMQRYCGPSITFRKIKDVLALIGIAAILGCAINATLGAGASALLVTQPSFLAAWNVWFVSDAMSVLLLTPVILTWLPRAGERTKALASGRRAEAGALFLLLALACHFIFGQSSGAGHEQIPLMYLVFPFILWAAVRLGPPEASAASLMVALFAIINGSLGRGARFFGPVSLAASVYWIQIYLAVVVMSGLVLTAIWTERTEAMTALEESKQLLSKEKEHVAARVEERTKELSEANKDLGVQIEERTRAEEALRRAHDELEARVRARTLELVNANDALKLQIEERHRAEQIIASQAREILDLATPIVKIRQGVDLVPLIGTFDNQRAQELMTRVLSRIASERSSVVLFDVTGVPAIDQETAQHLLRTISAVRLLGARAILTGVRPAIAQTMVNLGIDLVGVATRSTVAAGLDYALQQAERAR
jgi:integral membrane sensor domain MASE1/anti-anti-sigma regulatory factor